MIDLGSMTDKFSQTGQKVVRRAIEASKSRDHNFLSMLHVLTALGEVESALFAGAMQAVGVDPDSITRLLEEELTKSPIHVGKKTAIPEMTRDLFNRALRRARARGRLQIESYDLLATLFTDQNGAPAEILRRLGVDPALAADTIGQIVRVREEQAESIRSQKRLRIWQIFKISDLTAESLNSLAEIYEKGVTPDLWDNMDVRLTTQERRQVKTVVSSLLNQSVVLMNEATVWSRAIYPLLMLAEQGGLCAWAQLPLKAQYKRFTLEGIADGVIGYNLFGISKSFRLIVVEAKRRAEAQDPQLQLYGAMLAAARLNWEQDGRVEQEIFGCYTVADNWTFMHGLVSDIEADRPKLTVASSREYAEKIEAESILRILKFITGRYSQDLAESP